MPGWKSDHGSDGGSDGHGPTSPPRLEGGARLEHAVQRRLQRRLRSRSSASSLASNSSSPSMRRLRFVTESMRLREFGDQSSVESNRLPNLQPRVHVNPNMQMELPSPSTIGHYGLPTESEIQQQREAMEEVDVSTPPGLAHALPSNVDSPVRDQDTQEEDDVSELTTPDGDRKRPALSDSELRRKRRMESVENYKLWPGFASR